MPLDDLDSLSVAQVIDPHDLLTRQVQESNLIVQRLALGKSRVLALQGAPCAVLIVEETLKQWLLREKEQVRLHGSEFPLEELALECHSRARLTQQ